MKKSIYELQNPVDFLPYTNEYLIQALANMGQRIGLRGDGVQYGTFTFADLIGSYEYNADSEIGFIKYDKVITGESNILGAYFGIVDKGTLYNGTNNKISPASKYYITTSIKNIVRMKYQLQFDIPINNIEKYSPNSIIHSDGNVLTMILAGKYFGYDDEDQNNTEIIYNKFDIKTGELIYGFHAMYLYSDNVNDYYGAYKIYRNPENTDNYILKFQIFNPKYLANYADEFRRAFSYANYTEDDFTIFNILRNDISSDYIDIDNLEAYSDAEYVDTAESFDNISIADIIFHLAANNSVYSTRILYIDYNIDENSLFTLATDNLTTVNSKYLYSMFNIDINSYLELLNNDIVTLFYNIYKYYNNEYYYIDKHTLITRIMCKLYEEIAGVDLSDSNAEYNVMYIPLDLEFTYAFSSANELNIYYSNNIFVTIIDLSSENTDVDLHDFFSKNNTIVYDYEDVKKIKSCAFQIKYNDKHNDLIEYINIYTIYTLPYITANNTWSVNGEDTGISAIGADAGNPNIILLYSRGESVTVLSAFQKLNDVDITYSKRVFYVNPNMFHEHNTESNIECYAYIPDINNTNVSIFDNSIIISLSAIENLTDTELHGDYIGNYVMSLWKIDSEEYKFNYIVDPVSEDNYEFALTLDNMSSVFANNINNDIISGAIIKLKAKVYKLAQEADMGSEYNWVIIKAKNSEEYNEEFGLSANDLNEKYQNDLNVILQINRTVDTVGNILKVNDNDDKYISFDNTDHINTDNITNLIYPKYISETNIVTEDIQKLVPGTEAEDIYYVDTDIYGDVTMSTEQLANISAATSDSYITETVSKELTTSSLSTTEFYDEYVFNSDVPSFDLQEILLRNVNINNRVNILSLNPDGYIYNAYVGTSWNEADKSTLHIGTSSSNINIGNNTLIENEDKYTKFSKHDNISVDFDKIILNSKRVESSNILTKNIIEGKTYYTAKIRPLGMLSDHDMYAYTWDYMVKRYINNDEEFGSVISPHGNNTDFYGINNVDINPLTKLYICGLSNEHTEYQISTAENDMDNSSVIFRRLNIFTDETIPYQTAISDYIEQKKYIYNKDGLTEYFSLERIGNIVSNKDCIIGDTIDLVSDNIYIYPLTEKSPVDKEAGKLTVKRPGLSIVSDNMTKYVVYGKYDVNTDTGTFIYGYNTIDIYNLMRYYFNINLNEYASVNITAGNNTLIQYTDQNRKYWYLVINDDIYKEVAFNNNTDFDRGIINILNDWLDIVILFEDGKISIDIQFSKTNRTSLLTYYISNAGIDTIFDKQTII